MLDFHPDKTKYMRVERANTELPGYTMYNSITNTNSEKDIGVEIDKKLSFSDHLAEK